jgi:hypothetical protein
LRKATSALALAFALGAAAGMSASASPPLYVHPEDRSVGTDRPEAIVVARALLTQEWPASIQQVRVDATGTHLVAGIVISGVKFHRALDVSGFLDEAQTLIVRAFAAAPVEEVDLWTTVPIRVVRGAIVSGDLAIPTSRTVFACSVRRADLAHLRLLLHDGSDVFWDEAFAAQLRAQAADTGEDHSETPPIGN